jgi:ABC-type phosphate transport system substrate-binding protein
VKLKSKKSLAALVGVLAVVTTSTASADPQGAPQYRALAGVGSDTTTPVMNALSNDITINGVKVIGSYDATGSAAIATQAAAACQALARPNGSTAGRNALLASLAAGDGCLQFSRSSSLNLTKTTGAQLTYVPFALDGVTYAITGSDTTIPRNLDLATLQAIYTCNPTVVGNPGAYAITAMLPQAGSGTRSFWEGKMGILDADVVAGKYGCITDKSNNQPIEEQDGRVLTDTAIIPFSIASYNAEESQTIQDVRGNAVLGSIAGVSSEQINSAFPVTREVYNVIPTTNVSTAPWSTVFVGPGSLVCADSSTITKYGFTVAPDCGSTTNVTAP